MLASDIMARVDERVIVTANPVPSRQEWEALKKEVAKMENIVAAIGVSVPHTFGALTDLAGMAADGLRYDG